ncbi:uncharacterized protein LOC129601289 [Paramacrobiotus metropolitanus]|uniref:uncharacterized protein LOC129601289 n=1 Tax=Paramacrobiotus metropolitanus TaxID=2943436 RepID=UPI0024457BC5|nr:uncharacterized protein LOC129601289 [Paramacrobiotus metropolitanus]
MPAKSELLNFGRLIHTAQPFCRRAATGKPRAGRNAANTFTESTATTASASERNALNAATASRSVGECEQLIASLRASVVTGSRVSFGVCRLPDEAFTLYYGKPGLDNIARRISLHKPAAAELAQLARACDPASIGRLADNILDVSSRTTGQLGVDAFASKLDVERAGLLRRISMDLLPEQQRNQTITAQLCKMNVYSQSDCGYPHGDSPLMADSFGSLVVVFPTSHAGGTSVLRCGDQEWRFDSAQALSAVNQPAIAFLACDTDVQHEVLPVESGYRVTFTYILSLPPSTSTELIPDCPLSQTAVDTEAFFRDTLTRLLANPNFLPTGGLLGFGLQHRYPPQDAGNRKTALESIMEQLRGRDAAVQRVCAALSLPVRLKIHTRPGDQYYPDDGAVLTDHVIKIDYYSGLDDRSLLEQMAAENGAIVLPWPHGSVPDNDDKTWENAATMQWITALTQQNVTRAAYAMADDTCAGVEYLYGNMCLVAAVGPAGDRQAVFRPPPDDLPDGRTSRDLFVPSLRK